MLLHEHESNGDPVILLLAEMDALAEAVCDGDRCGWLAFHPGEELNNFNRAHQIMNNLNKRWDALRVDLQHRASKGTL
jgi:hypothetical protein